MARVSREDLIFALAAEYKNLAVKYPTDDNPQDWHKPAVFMAIAALAEEEYQLKDWRQMLPRKSRKGKG